MKNVYTGNNGTIRAVPLYSSPYDYSIGQLSPGNIQFSLQAGKRIVFRNSGSVQNIFRNVSSVFLSDSHRYALLVREAPRGSTILDFEIKKAYASDNFCRKFRKSSHVANVFLTEILEHEQRIAEVNAEA